MSVAAIVKDVPRLSLDEMKEVARALREAVEDIEDLPDVLAVPRSAVLSPGAQAVVYVDAGGGHYEPRKIKTGRTGDDLVEVLEGLDAGEKVVTTGSLLIDAETQISQSGN